MAPKSVSFQLLQSLLPSLSKSTVPIAAQDHHPSMVLATLLASYPDPTTIIPRAEIESVLLQVALTNSQRSKVVLRGELGLALLLRVMERGQTLDDRIYFKLAHSVIGVMQHASRELCLAQEQATAKRRAEEESDGYSSSDEEDSHEESDLDQASVKTCAPRAKRLKKE